MPTLWHLARSSVGGGCEDGLLMMRSMPPTSSRERERERTMRWDERLSSVRPWTDAMLRTICLKLVQPVISDSNAAQHSTSRARPGTLHTAAGGSLVRVLQSYNIGYNFSLDKTRHTLACPFALSTWRQLEQANLLMIGINLSINQHIGAAAVDIQSHSSTH